MNADTTAAPRTRPTPPEPIWADVARGFLATGIMISLMVMISFMLTGERTVAYVATATGLLLVASIPLVERGIDRT